MQGEVQITVISPHADFALSHLTCNNVSHCAKKLICETIEKSFMEY